MRYDVGKKAELGKNGDRLAGDRDDSRFNVGDTGPCEPLNGASTIGAAVAAVPIVADDDDDDDGGEGNGASLSMIAPLGLVGDADDAATFVSSP